jgi:diguanylate cyclase (GGDEF)-like protein
MRRSIQVLLAVLGVWAVGFELNHTALPGLPEALFGKVSSDVVLLLCGALCALRAVHGEGTERRAWAFVAAGLLLWTAGDLYWTLVLYDLEEIPIPSWADAGYLLFLPCLFAGLVLLARARLRHVPATLWLDGLVAALASAAVSAALVFTAVADGASGTPVAVITNLAYPIGDLALLALVVGAIALHGWRVDRTWALLGLAVLVFWVADSLYLMTTAAGTYEAGSWFDIGWALAAITFAAAAWVPAPATSRAIEPRRDGAPQAVVPMAFALLSLSLLVVGAWGGFSTLANLLAAGSLLAVLLRLMAANRLNAALLAGSRHEALTDALTGLGNRRRLTQDLDRALAAATGGAGEPGVLLALFDLDGFKHYNDSFGHPAGDALLVRLARALEASIAGCGGAYRMGGDEFCILVHPAGPDARAVAERAAAALSERGEGFTITASYGAVLLPEETPSASEALRLADQRMYSHKRGGRASASRQTTDALLRAMAERHPDLGDHTAEVAELAEAVARRLGLSREQADEVRRAAELHDVGKVAIPDAILSKPGPLDEHEWAFMHRHTLIGERIVAAAPALGHVAQLVRASHERYDGTGYPDRLRGEQIPLGARIVAVCDAFDAMTGPRPYRPAISPHAALAELRACAGEHFDPAVVAAFCQSWSERTERAVVRAA